MRRRFGLAFLVLVASVACLAPASPAAAGEPTHAWLCRPGLPSNPCLSSLTATEITGDGRSRIQRARRAKRPPIDCFYVYPTTSGQSTLNADLSVDRELRNVALSQASRFSQVCRVFAPVYRQITLAGILREWPAEEREQAGELAYAGVLSAWRQYLKRFNRGRGVVLIGHSQGTGMLKRLIQARIDRRRAARRRLVSAVLLGGNVVVPAGRRVGGDFENIPACRSARQTGCVVAYSAFDEVPPESSFFGRAGGPFGEAGEGNRALCVNPAGLVGRGRVLQPYLTANDSSGLLGGIGALPAVRTAWVSFPRLYRARCRRAGEYTWLHVQPIGTEGDERPLVSPAPTPGWGLHLWDVNLAIGNLVGLVKREAAAYRRKQRADR